MRDNKVTKRLTKSDILTIPNALSLFRLLLIPFIVWVYIGKKKPIVAFVLLILSGLTDILDGIIARKFNMVSDFGKFLDPVADKLTQFAVIVCLIFSFSWLAITIVVLSVREIMMLTLGSIVLKKTDTMNSAKWYGKLSTVVIYATISVLLIWPGIPYDGQMALFALGLSVLILSFVGYILFYIKLLVKNKKKEEQN